MTEIQETLNRLKLKLPAVPKPVGAYRPFVVSDRLAYLSGQISKDSDGKILTGKVGKDLGPEEGKRAAQWAALQAVALIQAEWGIGQVGQILRVVGFVQSADNFYGQAEVMNGASELLVDIFGESGRHARTSVGVTVLPMNAAVEIEMTLKLK